MGISLAGTAALERRPSARILACALNCRNAIGSAARPTAEPCEVCESCTEIRAGNSVDVIEIDAATNRGIDEIRELRALRRELDSMIDQCRRGTIADCRIIEALSP